MGKKKKQHKKQHREQTRAPDTGSAAPDALAPLIPLAGMAAALIRQAGTPQGQQVIAAGLMAAATAIGRRAETARPAAPATPVPPVPPAAPATPVPPVPPAAPATPSQPPSAPPPGLSPEATRLIGMAAGALERLFGTPAKPGTAPDGKDPA